MVKPLKKQCDFAIGDPSPVLSYLYYNFEIDCYPSTVRNLVARIATFGSPSVIQQTEWLQFVFPQQSVRSVSESYIADISPTRSDYDVLAVAGNDIRRVRQLLRIYLPLPSAKPKFAILGATSPRDRATLLNAGFDDVFDARMSVTEAQARILACAQRYASVAQSSAKAFPDAPQLQRLRRILAQLSPRERSICEALMRQFPDAANIESLATAHRGRRPLAPASLRVLISAIRAKLPAGVTISYAHPKSYMLRDTGGNQCI
ncbi:hypothetical protein [Novosphingobium jiangmenense]|uniref:OmpR/PhoB-type domain-containing protein n=1 Tax=Novosphingobium jiangmenense TaxID=2791981 RepID=A0ABS0HER6_9SPHN|nr:hypothetical protein [Novosphingobium jiangmenense]MBF9150749.1 hypothetical protein [Novosphingobium jiangmenense]